MIYLWQYEVTERYFCSKNGENGEMCTMRRVSFRAVCLLLAILIVSAAAMPAFAADRKHHGDAYVVVVDNKKDRLNVHGTPGPGDIVDHLETGKVVMYQSSDSGWWYVQWWAGNDHYEAGYVDHNYLVPLDDDVAMTFRSVDNLNVHSEPNMPEGECWKYHVDMLDKDTKLNVLDQNGDWARVKYGDKTGWVPSRYLYMVD